MNDHLFFMCNGKSGDGLNMIDNMDLSMLSTLLKNKPMSSALCDENDSFSEKDDESDDDSNHIETEDDDQEKMYKIAAQETFQSLSQTSQKRKKENSHNLVVYSDDESNEESEYDDRVVKLVSHKSLKLDENHVSRKSEIVGETKEKKNENNILSSSSTSSSSVLSLSPSFEPYVEPLYISTKSIISFLNTGLDLKQLLWQLPIIPYRQFEEGIIKKQFKLTTESPEELKYHLDKLEMENTWQQSILQHIENDSSKGNLSSRNKFKDVRKISVGVCKKDILSNRVPKKPKGVFYNCLVIIVRLYIDESFSEFHVKLFNTGKVEIPGIKTWDIYEYLLQRIIDFLSPFVIVNPIKSSLKTKEEEEEAKKENDSSSPRHHPHVSVPLSFYGQRETVLINSNFKCNFLINREKLVTILRKKYNVECHYNGDNYPAIKCHYIPKTNITSTFFDQTEMETKEDMKKENTLKLDFHHDGVSNDDCDNEDDDDVFSTSDDESTMKTTEEITKMLKESRKYVPIKKANKIRESAISFMIFRTGSVLIVGRCSEDVLYEIYEFVKDILLQECHNIVQEQSSFLMNSTMIDSVEKLKNKQKKDGLKRGIVIGKSKMKQLKKKIQIPMSLFTEYIPKIDIVNNIDVFVQEIKSSNRISKSKNSVVKSLKGKKKKNKSKTEDKKRKILTSSTSSASSLSSSLMNSQSKVMYAFKQVEPSKKNHI